MIFSRFARKRGALPVYWLIATSGALFSALIFTVNLIYQATTVGLNPLQLVLVGTTLEVAYFIFQIPTGIAADWYGRRRSIIIGYGLMGIGFLIEGSLPHFEAILLAQVVWGAGAAFVSGAEEAWLSDEVGEDGAAQAFIRAGQLGAFSGLIGIAFSVLLGSVSITLPILAGGSGYILLTGALLLFMPETGFQPKPRTTTGWLKPLAETLGTGARLTRTRPVLQIIIAIGLFYGLYSESYDRLWTDHMLTNFAFPLVGALQPVVWFGLMNAGARVLGGLGSEVTRRWLEKRPGSAALPALWWINVGQVGGLVIFSLAGNFGMALISFWLFNVCRNVSGPIWTGWINRQMDSEVRATMHSFAGQLDAFGQIIGGPVIGGLSNALIGPLGLGGALRAGLLIAAGVLSPPLVLYLKAMRDGDR
jgi:DHA3 family tetracycline resistance protein-like MFS transporter